MSDDAGVAARLREIADELDDSENDETELVAVAIDQVGAEYRFWWDTVEIERREGGHPVVVTGDRVGSQNSRIYAEALRFEEVSASGE